MPNKALAVAPVEPSVTTPNKEIQRTVEPRGPKNGNSHAPSPKSPRLLYLLRHLSNPPFPTQEMIPLSLHLSSSSPLLLTPPYSSFPKLSNSQWKKDVKLGRRRFRGICRAELSHDAPFAIAIGACMLNSLVFADTGGSEEEGEDAVVGTTDARFAVMSVISFIPYFNWLSWVFAWMDTSKRRYAVYAIVYLAPYLRSNLSLSPDESWLPIASIVLCIIHIQIEASIQSGDLDRFAFFSEAFRRFSPAARRKESKDKRVHHEMREDHIHLPSSQERLRDEIRKFGMPRKPFLDPEHKNPNTDEDEESEP